MAKAATAKKAPSKSEVFASIAEQTDLSKKQVAAVFDALNAEIGKALSKKGAGVFQVPGLCKIMLKKKPATKEREGIDPFTKQPKIFKAKPASNSVRVRPLKALKDMAPPAGK
jgi:nucleoid DNA-binding protein